MRLTWRQAMSTDRYTSRSDERHHQGPKAPADARFKGKEDYRFLAAFPQPLGGGQRKTWSEANYTFV